MIQIRQQIKNLISARHFVFSQMHPNKTAVSSKIEQDSNDMKSVLEQKDLSSEKLQIMFEERRKELEKICSVTKIPNEAKVVTFLSAAPVLLYPISFSFFPLQYELGAYYMKYLSGNLAAQAGIHWGLAISQHECQYNSINSTPSINLHFLFATSFLVSSFYMLNVPFETQLFLFAINSSGIFALDTYAFARIIMPNWLYRIKILIFLMQLGAFYFLYENKDKIQTNIQEPDVVDLYKKETISVQLSGNK